MDALFNDDSAFDSDLNLKLVVTFGREELTFVVSLLTMDSLTYGTDFAGLT